MLTEASTQVEWKPNKNYASIAVTIFLVIAASMLLYFILFRTTTLGAVLRKIFAVFMPVIYGFVIAYILNPVMVLLEKLFFKSFIRMGTKPSDRAKKGVRVASSFIALFLSLFLLYLLISSIVPELIHSIRNIVLNFPTYVQNVNKFINDTFHNPELDEKTAAVMDTVVKRVQDFLSSEFVPQLDALASQLSSGVMGVISFFKNFFVGLIISMYLLIAKEGMMARFRRFIYAVFNIETGNRLLFNLRFVDAKFGGFLIGKLIDSLIIGVITYFSCVIMRMPYSILISVVIGVTNIIPFFGPFLGAIPCTILIFVISPIKSLIFIIFILCLQQFDGNFLGPKILGNSVGISSYMVILSIIIGGGFFGTTGMVVAVPLCAVLTALIQTFILRRTKAKELPGDLESYHYVEQVNPRTHEFNNGPSYIQDGGLYQKIRFRGNDIRAFDMKIEERPWDRTIEQIEAEDALIRGETTGQADASGSGADQSAAGQGGPDQNAAGQGGPEQSAAGQGGPDQNAAGQGGRIKTRQVRTGRNRMKR